MRRFVLILLIAGNAQAGTLKGVLENNRGVSRFNDEKPVEAFDKFTEALGELPFSGAVHFNLGTVLLKNQEYQKALREFDQAVRTSPGVGNIEVRFRSHFNSAVALTAEKRIDEALEAYQRALDEKPDSLEAKHNIELLTKMQSGGGEGDKNQEQKDKNDQKKDQGKDPQKDPQKDQKDQKQQPKEFKQPPKATPRPFDSKELSQQDVGKILEELKRQEEQIRARMQNEKAKDAPPEKDW